MEFYALLTSVLDDEGVVTSVQLNDAGTEIRLHVRDGDGVAVDLSTAVTKQIVFAKPDCTSTTVTAVFATDGTDGAVEYVTLTGDFDVEGQWAAQASIEFAGNVQRNSKLVYFSVLPNI